MLIGTGLAIHRSPVIIVPSEIEDIMMDISKVIPNAGLEYGVYLKGKWDEKTATVTLSKEWYFPAQIVTAVTIEFTEEPPSPEWNVVIHRHPNSCRTFSSTDQSSINEEFLASLLYIPPKEFPEAIINIPLAPGSKLQVKAKIEISRPIPDINSELATLVNSKLRQRVVQHRPQSAIRPRVQVGNFNMDDIDVPLDPWAGLDDDSYMASLQDDFSKFHPDDRPQAIPREPNPRPMTKPTIHVMAKPRSTGPTDGISKTAMVGGSVKKLP
jgi:hypothetical protein